MRREKLQPREIVAMLRGTIRLGGEQILQVPVMDLSVGFHRTLPPLVHHGRAQHGATGDTADDEPPDVGYNGAQQEAEDDRAETADTFDGGARQIDFFSDAELTVHLPLRDDRIDRSEIERDGRTRLAERPHGNGKKELGPEPERGVSPLKFFEQVAGERLVAMGETLQVLRARHVPDMRSSYTPSRA